MSSRRGIFMAFTVQEGDLPPKGVINGVGMPHAGDVRLMPHGLHLAPSSQEALPNTCWLA